MNIQIRIEEKLSAGFELQHLDGQNESGNHNVADGAESHFRGVRVAEAVSGVPLYIIILPGGRNFILMNSPFSLSLYLYTLSI